MSEIKSKHKQYDKHNSSVFNLPANIVAAICYLIPLIMLLIANNIAAVFWLGYVTCIIPLIIFIFEKKSKLVKFHALQSIILNAILSILNGLILIISIDAIVSNTSLGVANIVALVLMVVEVVITVMQLWSVIVAYQYIAFRLPLIGDFAAKMIRE